MRLFMLYVCTCIFMFCSCENMPDSREIQTFDFGGHVLVGGGG